MFFVDKKKNIMKYGHDKYVIFRPIAGQCIAIKQTCLLNIYTTFCTSITRGMNNE